MTIIKTLPLSERASGLGFFRTHEKFEVWDVFPLNITEERQIPHDHWDYFATAVHQFYLFSRIKRSRSTVLFSTGSNVQLSAIHRVHLDELDWHQGK